MKRAMRFLVVLLVVLLCATLTACGTRTFSVAVGDAAIEPYRNLAWTREHTVHGWVTGDGTGAIYLLRDIADDLPAIQMDESMRFEAPGNGWIYAFDVYGADYARIGHRLTEEQFHAQSATLPEGVYYVAAFVEWRGRYVVTQRDYEAAAYEFIFKMAVGADAP